MGTHWNRARVSHGQYLTRVEPDVSYGRLVFHRVDAACFGPRQFEWAGSRALYDEGHKATSVLLVVSRRRRHRRLIDGRFLSSKRYIATSRYIKWPRLTRQLRLRLWRSETRDREKEKKREPRSILFAPCGSKGRNFSHRDFGRALYVCLYLPPHPIPSASLLTPSLFSATLLITASADHSLGLFALHAPTYSYLLQHAPVYNIILRIL